MLDHIEKFGLSKTERKKYHNELQSLNYLRVGLELLYKQEKKVEMEVLKQLDPNKKYLLYGNSPGLESVPSELIACSFHWYAASICNYVCLIGWLQHDNNPNAPTAKDYRDSVLDEAVINWRDKVAAHFARADNDKRDTPAERMASTLFPFAFHDDAFYASLMKLTTTRGEETSSSNSLKPWSLTKVHEQLRHRYWPRA